LYLKKKKKIKQFNSHIFYAKVQLSIQHFGYNYFTLLEGFLPGYFCLIPFRCSRDACELTFIHFLEDFYALAVSQLVLAGGLLPPKTQMKQMIKNICTISFVNINPL